MAALSDIWIEQRVDRYARRGRNTARIGRIGAGSLVESMPDLMNHSVLVILPFLRVEHGNQRHRKLDGPTTEELAVGAQYDQVADPDLHCGCGRPDGRRQSYGHSPQTIALGVDGNITRGERLWRTK